MIKENPIPMHENWKSRLLRLRLNFFPCYWFTGAKIVFIRSDFQQVRVKLPLTWRTRNIVGVTFGGSMFAATDPVYMTMFMNILGRNYIVWDKAGSIRYRKPGRADLFAEFLITDEQVDRVRQALESQEKLDLDFKVNLTDAEGVVHAEVEKVVHFRKKPKK